MKNIFIIVCLSLFSCSGTKNAIKPIATPLIKLETLHEKGIVARRRNYKSGYPNTLTYLFFNKNDTFNTFQGDFINVAFKDSSNINMSVGYSKNYGDHKNVLMALITLSESSTIPIQKLPIKVGSISFGNFVRVKLANTDYSDKYKRILFIKVLELKNDYDIIKMITNDAITINIDGQKYEFLNPELTLDQITTN